MLNLPGSKTGMASIVQITVVSHQENKERLSSVMYVVQKLINSGRHLHDQKVENSFVQSHVKQSGVTECMYEKITPIGKVGDTLTESSC